MSSSCLVSTYTTLRVLHQAPRTLDVILTVGCAVCTDLSLSAIVKYLDQSNISNAYGEHPEAHPTFKWAIYTDAIFLLIVSGMKEDVSGLRTVQSVPYSRSTDSLINHSGTAESLWQRIELLHHLL